MNLKRIFPMVLAGAAVLATPPAVSPVAAASKVENRCIVKASRAAAKFASTYLAEMSACRVDAADTGVTCPTSKNSFKMDKARVKLAAAIEKDCQSLCSISQSLPCVAHALCPARAFGTESCTAGAANASFDMATLGFPGPYCEQRLGRPVEAAADIAECMIGLMESTGSVAVSGLFGDVPSGVSKGGLRCLAAASKGLNKLTTTVVKAASKCRNGIVKGKVLANPLTCVSDDKKLVKKVERGTTKLFKLLLARCSPEVLVELDFCGNGIGGTTTVLQAQDCLHDLAKEIADSPVVPALRVYSDVSLIDAIYPPEPVCGDNLINQSPDAFLLLGEECDGLSDSACPGQCGAPGDLFECTCLDVPRVRFFVSAEDSQVDAGWTGLAHNQFTSDASGFLMELSGCDCDEFDGATCIGATSDSVCNLQAATKPVCSFDFQSGTRCDAHGTDDDDGDGLAFGVDEEDEDEDCYICDEFSDNAGTNCAGDGDCLSRCFDASGIAQGTCQEQLDCSAKQICRGRCDTQPRCLKILNGAPLPVVSSGAPVCTLQTFRTDVSGTLDIVTGSHEISYQLFSRVHFGQNPNRPCPVCGGFCVGGDNDLDVCTGRCTQSGSPCMVTADCGFAETCGASTPDCPKGICELSRVCGADPGLNPGVTGAACRVTSEHPFFGSVSTDCLPLPLNNVSGRGLEVDYLPLTSSPLQLDSTVPCTAGGFELLDCPCPAGSGGEPTRPNRCIPACTAPGPNFGIGCGDGNSSGQGTECAGGANAGKLCDQDSDCPGSTCSDNPKHCIADPSFERFSCDSDADCGVGACVDACPGGRCLPLCVPTGTDSLDGECAAGPPDYHCNEAKFQFKPCTAQAEQGGCLATCSGTGAACAADSMCPQGEICQGECESARECEAGSDGVLGTADDLAGAGVCIGDMTSCFLDPIVGEGGTTDNGLGDPTDMSSVGMFCTKPVANNPAVNNGAGYGGPTRVRIRGTNIANFNVIP